MGKKSKALLDRILQCLENRCADCYGPTRPCLVDEKPAVFHRFVEEDRALLRINAYCKPTERDEIYRRYKETGCYPDTCSPEVLRSTLALVEFADGSLRKVDPELVTLLNDEYK